MPGFTADAHEDATLVEEAAGGVHDQQQQHTHQYKNTNNYSSVHARSIFHGVLRRKRRNTETQTEQEGSSTQTGDAQNAWNVTVKQASYFQTTRLSGFSKAKTIGEANKAKLTTPPSVEIVHSLNITHMFGLKGTVHPIILNSFTHTRVVSNFLTFFCRTPKESFWRMSWLLFSIMKVNGD